jgi:hypothetical protein
MTLAARPPSRTAPARQPPGAGGLRFGDGNIRPAVGPAAGQRHVDAHAFRPALRLTKLTARGIRRQVGNVLDAARGIVQFHRIHGLDFEAAEAARLHGQHFAFQLRVDHGRAEPPPAHHRPRIGRRRCQPRSNIGDAVRERRRGLCAPATRRSSHVAMRRLGRPRQAPMSRASRAGTIVKNS